VAAEDAEANSEFSGCRDRAWVYSHLLLPSAAGSRECFRSSSFYETTNTALKRGVNETVGV
jgi:hypothetical protein